MLEYLILFLFFYAFINLRKQVFATIFTLALI